MPNRASASTNETGHMVGVEPRRRTVPSLHAEFPIATATPLLRQFHLAQERFVAGIRFEILEQRVSLDEIKTHTLLRVSAIQPSEGVIALAPVRMCLGNFQGIVARMFAREGVGLYLVKGD